MEKLFLAIANVGDPRGGGGDSFIDRLSCTWTTFLLLMFALLVTASNYTGSPIACFCPDHFTGPQEDYTNQFCWVKNTYYLPFDDEIPKEGIDKEHPVGYYQWVGLILAIQATLFYVPRVVWIVLNKKSGIAVSTITDAAIQCQKACPDSRDKTLRYMVKHMGRFLREVSRKYKLYSKWKRLWWRFYGNYLAWVYLFVKILYLANIFLQIYLLNSFLGTSYTWYGIDVLKRLIDGRPISESHRFPRVTMCDMKIRLLGNVQRYTIQCALPTNLFNEKLFIFIWFWFVFVAIATAGSFVFWLKRAIYLKGEQSYVKARLIAFDMVEFKKDNASSPEIRNELVHGFVNTYLRRDGIFILRLVGTNASDLIAAELICGLFQHFKENRALMNRAISGGDTAEVVYPSTDPSAPPLPGVDPDTIRKRTVANQ